MSPRRLLYAAEFGLRLLAFFLPRHRSKIRRVSWAVRGYGSLIVMAITIHQAQVARLHGHYSLYHRAHYHEGFRRRAHYAPAAYREPRRPVYRRGPAYSGYSQYAGYRPIYRAPAPCSWGPYPYRPCAPYPFR